MLCPRCKILMSFSTQEREHSHDETQVFEIYRCSKCGFQERQLGHTIKK